MLESAPCASNASTSSVASSTPSVGAMSYLRNSDSCVFLSASHLTDRYSADVRNKCVASNDLSASNVSSCSHPLTILNA